MEAKLDEILARMERFEAGQQRLEAGHKQLEAGQQRLEAGYKQLEAGQQRLETGQQQIWAAINAHARRTSERFDELESTMTKGFARVQGQVQLMTRVEHQDERADRLSRRLTELEAPKPPPEH